MNHPPKLVCKLGAAANGWLVGSAADPDCKAPKDWDVVIPFSDWNTAAMMIPADATPNTFGGWKCNSDGWKIDVWPVDLFAMAMNQPFKYAKHIKTGITIKKL